MTVAGSYSFKMGILAQRFFPLRSGQISGTSTESFNATGVTAGLSRIGPQLRFVTNITPITIAGVAYTL